MSRRLVFDPNLHLQVSKILPRLEDTEGMVPPKVVNWGALRLFVMMMQFFNYYVQFNSDERVLCVYAGAAPGASIEMVSRYYPDAEYHLYDPNGDSITESLAFDSLLHEKENVRLYSQEFTKDTAREWRAYREAHPEVKLYFISDVRSSNYPEKPPRSNGEGKEEYEKRIAPILRERERIILDELRMQEEWVREIQPTSCILKFRPPRFSVTHEKTFSYLDGYPYRGAFGDSSSIECFLVPNDNISQREWDVQEFEQSMDYHNYIFRQENFLNPIDGSSKNISQALGLMRDYDSCLFAHTILSYMQRYMIADSTVQPHHLGIVEEHGLNLQLKVGDALPREVIALLISASILNGLGRVYTKGANRQKKPANLFSRRKLLEKQG